MILPILLLLLIHPSSHYNPNALINEHVYGGLPSSENVMIQNAFIMDYDEARKCPKWVAYRLTDNYRRTPKREGEWKEYNNDPRLTTEPDRTDYSGVYQDAIRNYAHGHVAPFFTCGGDRDNDGMVLDANKDAKVESGEDIDEAQTVYEINYYTNLTPQHHNNFNGQGGIWYDIETHIRDMIDSDTNGIEELFVIAGPVFGSGTYDIIGDGVHVAPMFFQIVIIPQSSGDPEIEAYLIPHHQKKRKSPRDIAEYLVSIRHIEALTGLDFFPDKNFGDAERISTY